MKQKDIAIMVGIGIFAAIISAVVAGAVFSPSKTRAKAPDVAPITSTFPDVHNDSQYNQIFNNKAIDPTQLIKVGPSQNQQPFTTDSNP